MKYLLPLIILISTSCASINKRDVIINQVAETGCGLCRFDMTSDECRIAVKINQKKYFVEGYSIKEYCDPNTEKSLCSSSRDAKIVGKIKHGVFVVETFDLIEDDKVNEEKK